MKGITLDTGALIALERRKERMRSVWTAAIRKGVDITVPAPVIAEWWRGPSPNMNDVLDALVVEPLDLALAKLAGGALAQCGLGGGASVVDAVVMASAARRGDAVYTSDFGDLDRLNSYFRTVRLFTV